jgi:hypothetical protein
VPEGLLSQARSWASSLSLHAARGGAELLGGQGLAPLAELIHAGRGCSGRLKARIQQQQLVAVLGQAFQQGLQRFGQAVAGGLGRQILLGQELQRALAHAGGHQLGGSAGLTHQE